MRKTSLVLALMILFCILFAPQNSSAATIRTDKNASVSGQEVLSENVYLVGTDPKIAGMVNGDVFATGNKVEAVGNINGDFLSFGADIKTTGKINGDVRLIGGDVIIENDVSGDLVVIGGNITLNENVKIGGDIILIGGIVHLNNTSERHIRIVSRSTIISGKVLGTANITSENIQVLKDAEVSGEMSYFSPRQAHVEDGAKVSGSINFNKVDSLRENGLVKHSIVSFLNFWMLFRFITSLVLTFILVYVFKIFSQKTATQTLKSFWKSLLVGLVCLIFIPIIVVISLISLILLPVGGLIFMIYLGAFIISNSIAGIALGAFMKKAFSKSDNIEVSFQTAAIGITFLTLLQFVPTLGDATRFVFILAAFGAIWVYLYEKVRWGNSLNR